MNRLLVLVTIFLTPSYFGNVYSQTEKLKTDQDTVGNDTSVRPYFFKPPPRNISNNPLPKDVIEIIEYRTTSLNFFSTTIRIAELSTLSALGTDYHRNTNPQWRKRNYVLNTSLAPVFGLGGKQWITPPSIRGKANRTTGFMMALHILPEFKVRIFNEDTLRGDVSLPVRTPSYMAGTELFLTHKRFWDPKRKNHYFISYKGYHHSNGQDGLTIDTANSPHHTKGYFNTYNGDFGDNWVNEFYVVWNHTGVRMMKEDDETSVQALKPIRTSHEFVVKTGLGFHPMVNTTMRNYNMYSRRRLNIKLAYIYAPSKRDLIYSHTTDSFYAVENFSAREKFRASLNITYLGDGTKVFGGTYLIGPIDQQVEAKAFNMGKRLNIYGTVHYNLFKSTNTTLFAQGGYYGSDPYNAYFMESMWFFRFGIGLGFLKFASLSDDRIVGKAFR